MGLSPYRKANRTDFIYFETKGVVFTQTLMQQQSSTWRMLKMLLEQNKHVLYTTGIVTSICWPIS